MEFWFSGELDHRIAEAYRPVRASVEARLNARCRDRSYGAAVTEIAIIPMILGSEFLQGRPERRLWQRKQRAADYRTIINFENFRDADEAGRQRLLIENVIDAVRDLQRKAGDAFHGEALVLDILAEFGLDPNDAQDT